MEEPFIISDPQIMTGKPIIKGTRITVEHILEDIANGLNIDQILQEYPHLTREEVQAALKFAMDAVRMSAAYPVNRGRASA